MIDKISISIWERDFELPINYNCYEGENVTQEQIQLLNDFLTHPVWIKNSKEIVEDYCRQDVLEDESNQKKDNIFSYIKPMSIFVKHVKEPQIALICRYRYDEDHGVAVVFDNKGNATVGLQDIIL